MRRAVIIGGAALIILASLGWVGFGTSVLGVREVTVTGSQIAGADAVRSVAGIAPGTPLARLDLDAIAARVATLPSVARADVSRSWPHAVVIAVTERTAVAVVAAPNGFAVLDATGVIFHQVATAPPGVVLLQLAAPGPDDAATRAALRVVAALTPALRAVLHDLAAPSPTGIVLNLVDGRRIRWGDADDSDAKATVATALLNKANHTIDVSVPDAATTT